jgi:hypothetical protein
VWPGVVLRAGPSSQQDRCPPGGSAGTVSPRRGGVIIGFSAGWRPPVCAPGWACGEGSRAGVFAAGAAGAAAVVLGAFYRSRGGERAAGA